jgi:hypothetical protein
MKYRKFNKYEKKEIKAAQVAKALHGEGLYLFRNNTNADLTLPRPTKTGARIIGPKKEFQGDNYYMQLVKTGLLRLVKEIQSPEQQHAASEVQVEQKLILDQPDMITEQGKVEHVINKTPAQKLQEQRAAQQGKQPDVLLNEGPVADDGFVIVQ